MSPTEQNGPSLPSPDYRTKAQTDEKELFHILPQLQVKRADFLPVMLTGTLPQRRTFSGLQPENELPEPQGPKDDDVTKSESNSEASQKSTEPSQDGAPSTLMAEDPKGPREPVSAADPDPDMEDASKTLVLFSPGDNRKSPSAGYPNLEADFGCGITPLKERSAMGEEIQAEPSEPGGLTVALRSDLRAGTPIAPASPPFTKVERTFIHIAETSHLNVMSSSSQTPKESDRDLFAVVRNSSVEGGTNEWTSMVKQGDASSEHSLDLQVQSALDGHLKNDLQPKPNNCSTFVFAKSLESVPEATAPILAHEALCVNDSRKKLPEMKDITGQQENHLESEAPPAPKARIRSRIPVLVSEEDTGSEPSSSLSARARLQRRVRQLDLARLVVEKQQGQWMRRRLISGTSSSLSSGDDERRRASETLSTTGSEEDTHASDESLARRTSRLKLAGEEGPTEWRSRIPRPVTPIKRPSGRLVAAAGPSPLTLPGRGISRAATFIGNGLQSQRVGLSALHTQKRSKTMPMGSASSSCPRPSPGPSQPCGSPRMPLRSVFAARRSLSTSHCRTDSPSPQRVRPMRQPLSVRPTTAPPPRPRTTNPLHRSASQDPTTLSSTATPAKVKPKSTGSAKGKQSTGDKLSSAR